ncbi:MAG: glycosyltransferase [Gammaproteobacteria bacterium]|nr:glycosyltransferase [Gammaproteobacteria bacterium]MDJ0889851.1 glycosyltransferase [Gammaproteobacteria bacterium]
MERSMLRLAAGMMDRGYSVDIVVGRRQGELTDSIPTGANVYEIGQKRKRKQLGAARVHMFRAGRVTWPFIFNRNLRKLRPFQRFIELPAFTKYLRKKRPDAVLAAEPRYNLIAALARCSARVNTRVVISERVQPSRRADDQGPWAHPHLHGLLRFGYLSADAIVAVSNGVADDLATFARIPREQIATVYNPVIGSDSLALAKESLDHPWFAPDAPPVVLAAGRIDPQKDYLTLLSAFSMVRLEREVRLVILGAAGHGCTDYVQEVHRLAEALGIARDVFFPGFVANPFAYMAGASLFVLSSIYEGLPGVLVQALACGCPVVSTDCPSGPREILEDGRYGPLVPIGDDRAMADAMIRTLDRPLAREALRARGATFSVENAVDGYLSLLLGNTASVGTDQGECAAMTG